jgi:UDP-glucose 4-epimerase
MSALFNEPSIKVLSYSYINILKFVFFDVHNLAFVDRGAPMRADRQRPAGYQNNLMALLMGTALGRGYLLKILGGVYQTPDGSAIRDFINVVDLAGEHLAALQICRGG